MPDLLLARSTRPSGTVSLIATATQVATAIGDDGESIPVYRIDIIILRSDIGFLGTVTVVARRSDETTFERTFTRSAVTDPNETSRTFNGNSRWRIDSAWSFGLAVH